MVKLWLVRHGETAWNAEHRFQGWTDVPLNDAGREQARVLGEALSSQEFDHIWSSDLGRAVETARIARGEPIQDQRLRELDFGDIEGSKWDELSEEVRTSLQLFDSFAAPNGESIVGFRKRITDFLDGLSPGRHLIFAHGGVVRAVMRECGTDGFPAHTDIIHLNWTTRSK